MFLNKILYFVLPFTIFSLCFAVLIDKLTNNKPISSKAIRSGLLSGINIFSVGVLDIFKEYYKPSFLKVYYNINEYSIEWLIFSGIITLIGLDLLLYLTHYGMHSKILFKLVHGYHHQFTEPTALDFSAVHPLELILVSSTHSIIPLFIPVHHSVFKIHGAISSFFSILSHGGGFHLICKKLHLNMFDSDFHNTHHAIFNANYGIGIFTSFWDKLFGTYKPVLNSNKRYKN